MSKKYGEQLSLFDSIKLGLAQSAAGEVYDLGSFAQYAEGDDE